jgi:hypothetical protein
MTGVNLGISNQGLVIGVAGLAGRNGFLWIGCVTKLPAPQAAQLMCGLRGKKIASVSPVPSFVGCAPSFEFGCGFCTFALCYLPTTSA